MPRGRSCARRSRLVAFARREGVTHVVFGQTARSRIELVWRESTLNKFLSAVPDATVQVVPLTDLTGQSSGEAGAPR